MPDLMLLGCLLTAVSCLHLYLKTNGAANGDARPVGEAAGCCTSKAAAWAAILGYAHVLWIMR